LQAFAISIGWATIDVFFISPMLSDFLGQPSNLGEFSSVPGNLISLVGWLVLSWTLAAFGEEIAYRGYLINRFSDLSGKTEVGWMIGGFLSAVLFGCAHISQG
jgi:membrane protease YdiL (CAAX protease family)